MSSRSLNLDVLVRLKDRLSGPLRKLRETFRSLTEFARKIGAIGAAISVISFMGPIQEAAAFQQKLLDIAGTANLSGKAAFQFAEDMRLQFADLALATGQSSDAIASAAGGMIAAGLDVNQVSKAIGGIAKAATGANASIEDMAGVATAMVQNLHIPIDQLDDAMASLLVAGRLGAFEFKEMARYFPTLTGQMAQYGVVGREAVDFLGSALQIAKMGTADPAEAANNLKNFLSKLKSQDTIKNFAKAGVDIQKVMQNAAIQGINPVEAAMRSIIDISGISGKEITKMMKNAKSQGLEGADAMASVREQIEKIGRAGKLGTLFGDQQVMDFLIPAILNVEKFKDIKRAVSEATGELIDPAFKTNMEGLYYQLNTLSEVWSQVSDEVGLGFGAWLPMLNDNLAAAVKWYREFNIETNGMGKTLLTAAGGGVLLATAIGGLSLVLPIVGAGFAALGALISPVGIALAGLAAAGVYIWRNWGSYGPRLSRLWEGMKQRFTALSDGLKQGLQGWLKNPSAELSKLIGRVDALTPSFAKFRVAVRSVFLAARELFSALSEGLTGGAETRKVLQDYLQVLTNGAWDVGAKLLNKAGQGLRVLANAIRDFRDAYADGGVISGLKAVISDMSTSANVFAIGLLAANFIKLAGALRGLAALKISSIMAGFAGIPAIRLALAAGAIGLLAEKLGVLQTFNDWTGLSFDWVDAFLAIFAGLKIAQALAAPFATATAASATAGAAAGTAYGTSFLAGVTKFLKLGMLAGIVGSLSDVNTIKDGVEKDKIKKDLKDPVYIWDWKKWKARYLPDSNSMTPAIIDAYKQYGQLRDAARPIALDRTGLLNRSLMNDNLSPISIENARRARGMFANGATNAAGMAPASPPQKVEVGGQVTIKVEGPGKVTSITSTNPQAPLRTSNTGRVVGGV